MSTSNDRERRDAAFDRQGGLCHFCQQPMLRDGRKSGGGLRSNACTLDHLDDRYSPLRGKMPGRRVVAACYDCNNKRSQERNAQYRTMMLTGQPMPDGRPPSEQRVNTK